MSTVMNWAQQLSQTNDAGCDRGPEINFLCRDGEKGLRAFDVATQSLEEISQLLFDYADTLCQGHSLAEARGAILTCVGVSNSVADLFSTPSPTVIEGAPLTWVELILSLGPIPSFTQLEAIQQHVKLPPRDRDLIQSGRPWRFLSPWPGDHDCRQECQALQTAQDELAAVDRAVRQVSESIANVTAQMERRKELIPPLDADLVSDPSVASAPSSSSVGTSAAPSVTESRIATTSPTVADQNDTTTATTASSPSSASAPSLSTPSSEHGDGSASITSSRSTLSPRARNHRGIARTRTFIDDLYSALEDPAHAGALFWSDDGQSFVVAEPHFFSSALLAHLKAPGYDAFIRRLYYFGFHKIDGAFQHHRFARGRPCSIRPRVEQQRRTGSLARKSTLRSRG